MTALIGGELIKAVTTRTLLGYTVMGSVLMLINVVLVTEFSPELDAVTDKQEVLAGAPILLLLFALVGAAGEYRHRTAAPAALVARRDPGRLLLVRVCAYVVVSLVVACLMATVALVVGLPLLRSEPGIALGARDVVAVSGGSVIASALSAAIGVSIGALLRSQVVGVVGALILGFIVSPLLSTITATAQEYTPFGAGAALAGQFEPELSRGEDTLVLVAWTLVCVVAAVLAERRRDLA